MKREIINLIVLILIVPLMITLVGCCWLLFPNNTTVIGTGYIKYDKGEYVVKVNSTRYFVRSVYAHPSNGLGEYRKEPAEGMYVTCFKMKSENGIHLIEGNHSEEVLNKYFSPSKPWFILGIFSLVFLTPLWILWYVMAKTEENLQSVPKPNQPLRK